MSLIDLILNIISLTGLLNKIFKRCYFLNIYSFKLFSSFEIVLIKVIIKELPSIKISLFNSQEYQKK